MQYIPFWPTLIANLFTGYLITRKIQFSSFQFIHGNIFRIFIDDGISNLPDLNKVIFGCTTDNPGLIHVPAEVCEMVGVAAMHKEAVPWLALDGTVLLMDLQLWWTIFLVIWKLLFSNPI